MVNHWGMFSVAGEHAVGEAVRELRRRVISGEVRRMSLESDVTKMINGVGNEHKEVWDTTVREEIYDAVGDICDEQGWKRLYE